MKDNMKKYNAPVLDIKSFGSENIITESAVKLAAPEELEGYKPAEDGNFQLNSYIITW